MLTGPSCSAVPPGQKVSCANISYVFDASTGNMDVSAEYANPASCLAQAAAGNSKTKSTFTYDGTNIATKNGYGTLKVKPSSAAKC